VPTPEHPLTVAHRVGNDPRLIEGACKTGVDLIEGDINWWNGRLEVRHWKTMGRVPLLWDKWGLAPGWTRRLRLEEVLEAVPPGCELMLDLKRNTVGATREILACVDRYLVGREYTVCSQVWSALTPFQGRPGVRIVHSVGNTRLLRAVIPHLDGKQAEAISIHKRLLSPQTVRRLLERVPLIMTWPVNRESDLRVLKSWGVNGFISDRLVLLEQIIRESSAAGGTR
jgi:hypothetical protein